MKIEKIEGGDGVLEKIDKELLVSNPTGITVKIEKVDNEKSSISVIALRVRQMQMETVLTTNQHTQQQTLLILTMSCLNENAKKRYVQEI